MASRRYDPEENTTKLMHYETNETSMNESVTVEKVYSRVTKKMPKKHDSTTSSVNQISFRQHCTKNFSKSKMKTIKLTLTVIVLYIICSTPYFIGMIVNLMLKPEHYKGSVLSIKNNFNCCNFFIILFFLIIKEYFIVLSCLLFQLNSCVNPW